MINRSARERRQHGAGCGDFRIALGVGIFHDRIGVGDIEIIADQRDAEGRVEMVEEDALRIRHPIAIAVAQKRDAVALAGIAAGCRPGLDKTHDDFLRPLDRRGLRRLGFHHQHVAVGQHIERARMLQAGRKGLGLQALRNGRRLVLLPADDARNVHRRQQILLDVRQHGVGADLRLGIAAAVIAAGKTQQRGAQQGAGKWECHRATPTP